MPRFSAIVSAVVAATLFAPVTTGHADPTVTAAELAQVTGELLPMPADRSMDIAYLDDRGTVFTHLGTGNAADYETGSIGKTFTAALFADAVERGEVRTDTRVGDLLALVGAPVAEVTLEELAEHRSGLLEFAPTLDMLAGGVDYYVFGRNPFHADLPQLLAQARNTPLIGRGAFQYSTLGYALLGQAVAAAAHTTYATLLRTRMLEPLGLTHTWLPLTEADLPADVSTGIDRSGRPQAPWPLNATAPAGGLRSTVGDLVSYARALLDGRVPGMTALEPRWPGNIANTSHGYSWSVVTMGGHEYTLHSGGTGGFSSLVLLDRSNHSALVFLRDIFDPALERAGIDILRRLQHT
ncbi:serine hydrolase domain-containing protein [Nocardia sp. NPDC127579]|uniref:serine hydrolase domain-containing protein n=1 Tax=Nocardia sp. NPDC127579 TaxID=3345402 RepID=UPI0036373C80